MIMWIIHDVNKEKVGKALLEAGGSSWLSWSATRKLHSVLLNSFKDLEKAKKV